MTEEIHSDGEQYQDEEPTSGKAKETFWVIIVIVGQLFFFFYLEIFGIAHAFQGHGVGGGVFAIFVPPVAWYRSIEYWWHDDFAGVNWDKRLEYDAQACIGFINATSDLQRGDNVLIAKDIGKAIDEFSKEINRYPEDKREYLKRLARNYILYVESFWLDFTSFVSNRNDRLVKSHTTLKHEVVLKEYPCMNEVLEAMNKLVYDKLEKKFQGNFADITKEELQELLEAFRLITKNTRNNMRTTYRNIFDEGLEEQ